MESPDILSKQSDHENATCKSFHSGKTHSAWLAAECGGCIENHPWWTHAEYHHLYHHLPPAHCSDVHPANSHDEFEHKGIKCDQFHLGLDHDDWELENGLNTAEQAEAEHEGEQCDRYHPGESHSHWDDSKEHPGNTCDEEHPEFDHYDWNRLDSMTPSELSVYNEPKGEFPELRTVEINRPDWTKPVLIVAAIIALLVMANQCSSRSRGYCDSECERDRLDQYQNRFGPQDTIGR